MAYYYVVRLAKNFFTIRYTIIMLAPILLNTPIYKFNNNVNNRNINFRALNADVFEFSSNKDYDNIKNSIKKENFIGAGFEGRVYEMQDPDYVVKIPKNIDDLGLKKELIEEEVSEQDEVNHVVKKYKNGITIMKKIPGKSISSLEDMNEVANLPVSAYQKLLNQIIDADKADMEFDFAMNNVLYDKDSQSLTAIDFRPYKDGKRKFNPLEKMFFVFDCFKQPYEKKISGKILSAAINNMKSDSEQKISPFKYDYKEILRILEHNNPQDFVNILNIKNNIDTIVFNSCNAETDYQKSKIDDYIDYTNELIKNYLI